MTKRCFKCGVEKPRSEFYEHVQMGDGLLGKCKQCTIADVKARRVVAPEVKQNWNRNYRTEQKLKHRAHMAVYKALIRGKLTKQPCEICGGVAEAHHDDYSKRLEVRWLCKIHHSEFHKEQRQCAYRVTKQQ